MNHIVAKDFKTVDRKFSAGDLVSETDIHPEGHLSFDDWKKRGFIATQKEQPSPPRIPAISSSDETRT